MSESISREEKELVKDLAWNEFYHRREMVKQLSHPKRDLDADCGYEQTSKLTPELFLDLYERFPLATRVVDLPVDDSWRKFPYIYENKDPDAETEFERAWKNLDHHLNGEAEDNYLVDDADSGIWEYLKRADKLSRIGHYGIIMLELDDVDGVNVTWKDPAPNCNYDEEYESSFIAINAHEEAPASQTKLIGLRCFDQVHAEIVEWYESGPMTGHPRMYRVKLQDAETTTTDSATLGVRERDVDVHWSRVIHIADGLMSSEFIGTPAMRPVVNDIQDLRKIYGASAEGYWRVAFPWLSFESHPNLGAKSVINKETLADEVERAKNTLDRYMATVGGTWKTISGSVTDPAFHITPRIEAICVYLGVPVRIFKGSERGELASSTDRDTWNERMMLRQQSYLTPKVIAPFLNRLIKVGVLPKPAEGFQVEWPDLTTLSLQAKATWAVTQVNAITKYIGGGGDYLISPKDFLTKVLGFSHSEAKEILDNTQTHIDDNVDETEVIGREPKPIEPMNKFDEILQKRNGNQTVEGLNDQIEVAGREGDEEVPTEGE